MKKKNNASLLAHIARVEGQLSAVRKAIEANDCSKAAKTLLAASRSLQSARSACVGQFLTEQVFPGARVADSVLLADVQALIKA